MSVSAATSTPHPSDAEAVSSQAPESPCVGTVASAVRIRGFRMPPEERGRTSNRFSKHTLLLPEQLGHRQPAHLMSLDAAVSPQNDALAGGDLLRYAGHGVRDDHIAQIDKRQIESVCSGTGGCAGLS